MTVALMLKKKKKRRKKHICVKVWTGRRDTKGTHQTFLKDLQCEDMRYYVKYVRMDDALYFIVSKYHVLLHNKVLIYETR
jgi:hypothetical protein